MAVVHMDNLTDILDRIEHASHNQDVFFLTINAVVIYLMQCGFAFLEAGSVRSKNVTNILIKNLLDSCFSGIAYWICGYAFAYGSRNNPFIGYSGFLSIGVPPEEYHSWFFQFVFAATCSTIVSGAVAERCEFLAYVVYSCALSGFVYPVVSHWAWDNGGWLKKFGYVDFAGSGVVHLCGGICAMVGAAILGPRIGRFPKKGEKLEEIRGHSVPFAALGGFILFFGFFSFNGGSQLSISKEGDGVAVARAMKNTILSGSWAAMCVLLIARMQQQRWSLLTTINGCLAGMVAICAGCDAVEPWAASVIGIIAGISYLLWSWAVEKMKIDDPLDATAVHAGGGSWGVLAVPFFHHTSGIFYNIHTGNILESAKFLGWNLVGIAVICAWSLVLGTILFGILKVLRIFRVQPEVEIKGLDIYKHQEPAYPSSAYGHGWGKSWKAVANFKVSPTGGYDGSAFEEPQSPAGLATDRDEIMGQEHPEMDWLRNRKNTVVYPTPPKIREPNEYSTPSNVSNGGIPMTSPSNPVQYSANGGTPMTSPSHPAQYSTALVPTQVPNQYMQYGYPNYGYGYGAYGY